ncbi:hypothetical protein F383_35933 [Gossypium arboreum]|uniref:Uncharacterized protein n=1 Tax=Gossypium arboreum TaxID=29729 RepID=A0A0B0N7Y8_GOSAR|nr:hypothetical protein F383_35933 [Gossypium arboreum]
MGHGIGIEMRASVRHVWDMHQLKEVNQCKTRLRHASTTRCVSVRPCLGHGIGIEMRASVRPCLGHGIVLRYKPV